MKRRTFLKTAAGGAALAGLGLAAGTNFKGAAFAQEAPFPDLVAVRGTSLPAMFDKALEALGGLGRYVKSGQTVLVKPNMAWAVGPEAAANTNPALVSHIIKNALNLGARKVYVFDNTCDNWRGAYENSGLRKASEDAGATVAPANSQGYFQEVEVPGAAILKSYALHELYLEADVIINAPVLKHHGGAKMTACIKNLMGAIWSRGPLHRNGVDETLPELLMHRKPTLNIVDALRVMLSGGPRGHGDSKYLAGNMLIASEDAVAADAASAAVMATSGIKTPEYIALAAEKGLGVANLARLNIQRLNLGA
jgi:uncharacterized protein (DUF362 family)